MAGQLVEAKDLRAGQVIRFEPGDIDRSGKGSYDISIIRVELCLNGDYRIIVAGKTIYSPPNWQWRVVPDESHRDQYQLASHKLAAQHRGRSID